MADEKATTTASGRASTKNQPEEPQHDVKALVVEKANRGDFSFNEDQFKALVTELGLEKEVDDSFIDTRPEKERGPSPTAGLTPATGSGGVPYRPDAATEETKEAAAEAQERIDEGVYDESTGTKQAQQLKEAADKRLAAAVPSE